MPFTTNHSMMQHGLSHDMEQRYYERQLQYAQHPQQSGFSTQQQFPCQTLQPFPYQQMQNGQLSYQSGYSMQPQWPHQIQQQSPYQQLQYGQQIPYGMQQHVQQSQGLPNFNSSFVQDISPLTPISDDFQDMPDLAQLAPTRTQFTQRCANFGVGGQLARVDQQPFVPTQFPLSPSSSPFASVQQLKDNPASNIIDLTVEHPKVVIDLTKDDDDNDNDNGRHHYHHTGGKAVKIAKRRNGPLRDYMVLTSQQLEYRAAKPEAIKAALEPNAKKQGMTYEEYCEKLKSDFGPRKAEAAVKVHSSAARELILEAGQNRPESSSASVLAPVSASRKRKRSTAEKVPAPASASRKRQRAADSAKSAKKSAKRSKKAHKEPAPVEEEDRALLEELESLDTVPEEASAEQRQEVALPATDDFDDLFEGDIDWPVCTHREKEVDESLFLSEGDNPSAVVDEPSLEEASFEGPSFEESLFDEESEISEEE